MIEFLARLVPESWRGVHHLLADLGAYFWLPCRRCGVPWGGHESAIFPGRLETETVTCEDGEHHFMVCPRCTREIRDELAR